MSNSQGSATTAGKGSGTDHVAKSGVASHGSDTVKDRVAREAETAKHVVSDAASDVADAAKIKAEQHADRAADTAARQAETAASKIREAGSAFGAESIANTAADRIAANLSDAASAVRSADFGSIQDDLTNFARQNPLLFFGGAAVLGFAAGRLLKASERADDDYSTVGSDDGLAHPSVNRTSWDQAR